MEEAERLCDRIVIIDHGKVIANDTVRGLYQKLPASRAATIELDRSPDDSVLASLGTVPGISAVARSAAGVRIEADNFGAPLARSLEIIARHGLQVTSVNTSQVNLENVFIALTGHALRDGPVAEHS